MDADAPSVRAAEASYRGSAAAAFRCGRLPEDWPDGRFDLIVLSEWLYYLGEDDRELVADAVRRSLMREGDVVAVHWSHPIPETRTLTTRPPRAPPRPPLKLRSRAFHLPEDRAPAKSGAQTKAKRRGITGNWRVTR